MSVRSSRIAAALALAACGCNGLTLRGADAVEPKSEPHGKQLGAYRPHDCRTPDGKRVTRNTDVLLVDVDGRRLLVERTPGYDSLVLRNVFLDRGELAFQAVIKSTSGRLLLHEFRVPSDPSRPGRMAVATSWQETALEGGGFRAYFDRPVLTCQLALPGSEAAEQPAAPSSPAPTAIGTPEPRDRYAVGESVAVDVRGQLVRAKVVQAVDQDRYYVEYQTTPPSSEWVDKARIRGRL